jgi:hypothetical protein
LKPPENRRRRHRKNDQAEADHDCGDSYGHAQSVGAVHHFLQIDRYIELAS